MKRVAVTLCAVLSVALAAQEVEIPRNIKRCTRDSDKYNECLRDAIQDGISKFAKGVPELGVPVLDPYLTELHEVTYGNGFINGKMTVKNANTYGTSRARVLGVKATVGEGSHRLEIDVLFPRILIEGEYKAEGRLNEFVIGGKGFFNVSMEGVRTIWDITGSVEDDRWVIKHFRMLPEVEKMKVYFDDLFNGSESINTAARGFINEYWSLFYKELLPVTAVEWDKQMTAFLNVIFSKLSYSKLFA
ncbi:uncharacterized protein LOC105690644 [Athalia rosae]|uniref:uncharacterized protein LOC105690644 n=1 Tax=Athalia rosae TaxID=37344 RepID=UPI0020332340|nr:uncharacterized protein LOC105690644 [Athalia rosae]